MQNMQKGKNAKLKKKGKNAKIKTKAKIKGTNRGKNKAQQKCKSCNEGNTHAKKSTIATKGKKWKKKAKHAKMQK